MAKEVFQSSSKKTYLHSTMTNDYLSGLAMIAIEHQLHQELNTEEIVKSVIKEKARKVFQKYFIEINYPILIQTNCILEIRFFLT